MVLETTVLPVTPCSRSTTDFSLYSFSLHNKRQTEVCATSMLSEGIEPPMTAQGRLIYSQVQCHSASSAFRRPSIRLSKNKRSESFRTQSAETARSLLSLSIELDLILGAGIRSRWINAAVVNNRRNVVRPI